MFKRVVVALDNSPHSDLVFQQALDLAKVQGSRLLLVHVLTVDEADVPPMPTLPAVDVGSPANYELWESYREQRWIYEQNQLQHLRQLSEQASMLGIEAEFTINSGDPGRTICALATSWNADLILMGRRGYSGVAEWIMGSASNYVLHHAPCAVLTIQGAKS
ncbi:MAG: universal stress protein [Synechococcales cyanobacterium]